MTEGNGKGGRRVPTWVRVAGIVGPIVVALIGATGLILSATLPEVLEYLFSEGEAVSDQSDGDKVASGGTDTPALALPPIDNTLDEPLLTKPKRASTLSGQLPEHVRMPKSQFNYPGQDFGVDSKSRYVALIAVDPAGRSVAHDFRLEALSDGSPIRHLRSNNTPQSAKLFVVPAPGRYRLHLAPGATDHGDVVVHLFSPEATSGRTLRPDSAIRGAIIDKMEVDFFSIPVRESDRLLVLFRVTDFVGFVGAELFGERGPLASNDLDVGGVQHVTANADGRLVLAVFGEDREADVPYEVYVKELAEPIVLEGDEEATGRIAFIGDNRKYTIDVHEGSHWRIDLQCHGDLKSNIQIVNPRGSSPKGVAACTKEVPYRADIKGNPEGTYTIVVEGRVGSTGDFTLTVRELQSDPP